MDHQWILYIFFTWSWYTIAKAQDVPETCVLNCPQDITRRSDPGESTTDITWEEPQVTDCFQDVESTHNQGSFSIGVTDVMYTATGGTSNNANCSFSVTVLDLERPILSCPSDIITPETSVFWELVTATDNSDVVGEVTCTHISGDNFALGHTTVACSASDESGNVGRCNFIITVDQEPPMLTCPSSILTSNPSLRWGPLEVTDRTIFLEVNCSHTPGDIFPSGVTVVRCFATDDVGNTGGCSFRVTVDQEPPTLACPSDIITSVTSIQWDPVTGTDNIAENNQVTCTHKSGDSFAVGDTKVVCFATDDAGNTGDCSFLVIVDQESPVLTCPSNIITSNTSVRWEQAEVADNEATNLEARCSYTSGDAFMSGTTNVTCYATDDAENTGECSFAITVDQTPPNITCSSNILTNETSVSWRPVTAEDERSLNLDATCFPASGEIYSLGETNVRCSATDEAGNIGECSFVVTVDQTPPNLSCPSNITTSDISIQWDPVTATDDYGAIGKVTCTHNSGDIFAVGDTIVECFATDEVGNTGDCSFLVIVDQEAPVLTCPSDIITSNASVQWEHAEVTDNKASDLEVNCSHTSGDVFMSGVTDVTCYATDDARNTGECSFVITVDQTPPNVTCSNSIFTNQTSVAWSSVTAEDDRALNLDVTCYPASGEIYTLGETNVRCSATDEAGNIGECSFIVTVDQEPPEVMCPDDIYSASYAVLWDPVTGSDNHGAVDEVTCTHESGDIFAEGDTNVGCLATDEAGNTGYCNFSVIIDQEAPVLTCPSNIITSNTSVQFEQAEVTDNKATGLEVNCSNASGDVFLPGITDVTCYATDDAGNTGKCSFVITVDQTPPNVTCSNNIFTNQTSVAWSSVTAEDDRALNLDGTCYPASGEIYTLGETNVRCSATDEAGNIGKCSFIVTVDQEPPEVMCPDDIYSASYAVLWDPVTGSDNHGAIDEVTCTHESGDSFSVGDTNVGCLATDKAGNTGYCNFSVIIDQEAPVLTCPSNIITSNTSVQFEQAEVTDNKATGLEVNCSHTAGDVFLPGVTDVICSATDDAGNTGECSFVITVDQTPPNVTCSNNIFTNQTSVAWSSVTAEDDRALNLDVTCYPASGEIYTLGETNVRCSATDEVGNIGECSFIVTVDQEPPEVMCPDDIYSASYAVLWDPVTGSDNHGAIDEVTCTHESGDIFAEGDTNVGCFATDKAGNTGYCNFSVIIDQEAPVLTCPSNIITSNTSVQWEQAEVTDNKATDLEANCSHISGDAFMPGVTDVICSATDDAGNTGECTFVITVDQEPPVITCPSNIFTSDTSVRWKPVTGTDNYGLFSEISCSHISGETFALGDTTVECFALDIARNRGKCSFVVQVDQESPVLSCPTSVVTFNTSVTWDPVTASDNSGGTLVVACTHTGGDSFTVDITMVECFATDDAGNRGECSFNVTVDQELPTLSCPDDIYTSDTSVLWDPVTATDNTGMTGKITCSHTSGDVFELGDTSVECSATDEAGNIGKCSFRIYVDHVKPAVNCPKSIITSNSSVMWDPVTASDNSGRTLVVACTHTGGQSFTSTVTMVECFATDDAGNRGQCNFTVTVDKEQPTLTCPGDILTSNAMVTWDPVTVTDNSNKELEVICNHTSGDTLDMGVTPITCFAVDEAANKGECSFLVTLDQTPPKVTCPRNISTNQTSVSWSPVTAEDDGVLNLDVTCFPASGETFSLGKTNVRCSATDEVGNIGECTFVVTVDQQPPTLTCPGDIISSSAIVVWDPVTAIDDSGKILAATCNPASGDTFDAEVTPVRCSASDEAQHTVECSFLVIVDAQTPTCSSIPDNITQTTDSGQPTATVTWTPPAIGDNSALYNVTHSHLPGELFSIGITPVTYTVNDKTREEIVCSFVVNIIDAESPDILNMPNDQMVNTDAGKNYSTVTWLEPSGKDNSGIFTMSSDWKSGDHFFIGDNVVTYMLTDASGNMVARSFFVTVVDDEPPSCSNIPDDIESFTDPGLPTTIVDWISPTITDNSGVLTTSTSHEPGETFSIGKTTIQYVAIDPVGSETFCHPFFVEVIDNELPDISETPSNITIGADHGLSTASVSWTEPKAADNSGVYTLTVDNPPGSSFHIGVTIVTYTVMDPSGNSVEESFSVSVEDHEVPVISNVPMDVVVETEPGKPISIVTWMDPDASDNSGDVTLTSDFQPGHEFPIGNNTVTFTASDPSGNYAQAIFSIQVEDNESPVFGVIYDIERDTDPGDATATFTIPQPFVTDNSGSVTVTSNFEGRYGFPVGHTYIEFTARDPSGHFSIDGFIVMVIDKELPEFSNTISSVNVLVEENQTRAVVDWIDPTVTDNSGSVTLTQDHGPGDIFDLGDTTVTYRAVDPSGNTAVHRLIVQVAVGDGCSNVPGVITTTTDPGASTGVAYWTPLTISGARSGATDPSSTPTCSHESGESFPLGDTLVTCSLRSSSVSVQCQPFTITVVDNERPVFVSAPEDIDTTTEPGQPFAFVAWDLPIAEDNVGMKAVAATYSSGRAFLIGSTTVSIAAIDIFNHVNTHSFTVTVRDEESPVIGKLLNEIRINATHASSVLIHWPENEIRISDNSGSFTLSPSHSFPGYYSIGVTTVTFTATDPSGNFVSGSFTVRVQDFVSPWFLDIPEDVIVGADRDQATTIVSWTEPTAKDNSGKIANFTKSHSSGQSFEIGGTTVTYIAKDASGNEVTTSFLVVIIDDQPPMISNIPDNIRVNAPLRQMNATVRWQEPSVSDNSGEYSLMSTHQSGSRFPLGITTVTYNAADRSGNSVEVSFLIKVQHVLENLPDSMQVNTDPGKPTASVTWTPPSVIPSYTLSSEYRPGYLFPIGSSVVTYTASNQLDDMVTYSFTITVIDAESPVIGNLPSDKYLRSATCASTIIGTCIERWPAVRVSDNSGFVDLSSNYQSEASFPIGVTSVTFTALDPYNNRAVASFNVYVIDDQAPIITTIPTNLTKETLPGQSFAVVIWDQPTAIDDSGSYTVRSEPMSGSRFGIGSKEVLITATDLSGNVDVTSFLVTIEDKEPPEILNLPSDLHLPRLLPGQTYRNVSWTPPSVRDNSGGDIRIYSTHAPGSMFPAGITTVTYAAVDPSLNQDTVSFTINIPPVPTTTPVSTTKSTTMSKTTKEPSTTTFLPSEQPKTTRNVDVKMTTINTPKSTTSPLLSSIPETTKENAVLTVKSGKSTATTDRRLVALVVIVLSAVTLFILVLVLAYFIRYKCPSNIYNPMKPKHSDEDMLEEHGGTYTYPESSKLARAKRASGSVSSRDPNFDASKLGNAYEPMSSMRVWQSRPGMNTMAALSSMPFEVTQEAHTEPSTENPSDLSAYNEANTPGKRLSISEDIIESTHVDIEPSPSTIIEEDEVTIEPISTVKEGGFILEPLSSIKEDEDAIEPTSSINEDKVTTEPMATVEEGEDMNPPSTELFAALSNRYF